MADLSTMTVKGVDLAQPSEVETHWFYIETAVYYDDAENPDEQVVFRAHVEQAAKQKQAEAAAVVDSVRAHPDADRVEFFQSRRISDEKAQSIVDSFVAGTWDGI